jgi:hypothetical protein
MSGMPHHDCMVSVHYIVADILSRSQDDENELNVPSHVLSTNRPVLTRSNQGLSSWSDQSQHLVLLPQTP